MDFSRRTLIGGAGAVVAGMATTELAEAKTSRRFHLPKKKTLVDVENPTDSLRAACIATAAALAAPALIKWAGAANRCSAQTLRIVRWEGVFDIPLRSEDTLRLFAEAARDFKEKDPTKAIREGGMNPALLDVLVTLQEAGVLVKHLSMYRTPAHQMHLVHTGQTTAKGEGNHPLGNADDMRPLGRATLRTLHSVLDGHFGQFIPYPRANFAHISVA